MSENKRHLQQQLNESRDKFVYFFMAASGSCIAFAVHTSAGLQATWPMLALAVAVVLWAVSIYCGIQNRYLEMSSLFANFELLNAEDGQHPEIKERWMIEPVVKGIEAAIRSNAQNAKLYADGQLWCFLLGGLAFVAWHAINFFVPPQRWPIAPT